MDGVLETLSSGHFVANPECMIRRRFASEK
jgi:hypothetical protein